MVTVPAFVWRGGFFRRALMIGTVVGICLGLLAWVDSGAWLGGVIAIVITGVLYGILMPRRMARYWPGAKQLSGDGMLRLQHGEQRRKPVLCIG